MSLCMFTPLDRALERGWPGRIEGNRVIHLAAQTLQAYFAGGGEARANAEYSLDEVRLLAPVIQPPSVRLFEAPDRFVFANPAALVGPGAAIRLPQGAKELGVQLRVAAVVGRGTEIGGLTILGDWRAAALDAPKDRDFALGLGPVVVSPLALGAASVRVNGAERAGGPAAGFPWDKALGLAARNTELRPGDLIGSTVVVATGALRAGDRVELVVEGIGRLGAEVELKP
ncbi:MAG: fumarylacetoacetate hydrolase family protein [Actinobacteria bacterium]|nr:fumarylacetoacetate hydrolase family protein [Actinomycetota bacterium]